MKIPEIGKKASKRKSAEASATQQPAALASAAAATSAAVEAVLTRTAERRSSQIERLRSGGDGPYYIAPDSVEPLPSGMWSSLDPAAVQREADRFPRSDWPTTPEDSTVFTRNAVPRPQREFLQGRGPAAKRLLEDLERGL